MYRYLLACMFILAGCTATGNAVFSTEIVSNAQDISDSGATVTWTTNQPRTAMFVLDDDVRVFEENTQFQTQLTGLAAGTTYDYIIVVCVGQEQCRNHQGEFTTTGEKTSGSLIALVGAGIQIPDITLPKIPTGLLAVLVIGIAAAALIIQRGPGFRRTAAIEQSLRSSREHLASGNYANAVKQYHTSREQYSAMKASKRSEYHPKLLALYNELQQQKRSGKANALVEKYADGTISPKELDELTELLTQ